MLLCKLEWKGFNSPSLGQPPHLRPASAPWTWHASRSALCPAPPLAQQPPCWLPPPMRGGDSPGHCVTRWQQGLSQEQLPLATCAARTGRRAPPRPRPGRRVDWQWELGSLQITSAACRSSRMAVDRNLPAAIPTGCTGGVSSRSYFRFRFGLAMANETDGWLACWNTSCSSSSPPPCHCCRSHGPAGPPSLPGRLRPLLGRRLPRHCPRGQGTGTTHVIVNCVLDTLQRVLFNSYKALLCEYFIVHIVYCQWKISY